MTTSQLNVEDGAAQFEVWFAGNMFIGGRCIADAQTKRRMLKAWQASRAAIVVKLPDYNGEIDDELSCFDGEYEWGNRAGASYAVTQCAGIIRAAGITVKGNRQ